MTSPQAPPAPTSPLTSAPKQEPNPKILVAIPTYRCEGQIVRVLAAFDANLLAQVERVVVIDNQSPDQTLARAQIAAREAMARHGGKIEVVQNPQNLGLGGTQKRAFAMAQAQGADYVAILHGDDQASVTELLGFIALARAEPKLSAILGSRFMPASRLHGYSWLRKAGNRGLNLVYGVFTGQKTLDLGSGLNLFKTSDLDPTRYREFGDGMTFNIDWLLDAYARRLPIRFVPITWTETDQTSNARTFRVGFTALKLLIRWRFKTRF